MRSLWTAFVVVMLAACEPIPVQDLSEIDWPEGATLDTTHTVRVRVVGASSQDSRTIKVTRDDGTVLLRSSVGNLTRSGFPVIATRGSTTLDVIVEGLEPFAVSVVDDAAVVDLGGL